MNQFAWMRHFAATVFVCLAVLLAGVRSSHGQGSTGGLQGTVLDPQGHAVGGASIAVSGIAERMESAVTDGSGKFTITGLAPGIYTVVTSATGFATDVRHAVTVTAGTPASVSVSLSLASVSEEVTVEAEADTSIASQLSPVKSLLDAGSARTEITSQYVTEYTSPVTDFSDIVQAAPGTVSWSNNGIGNGQAKIYFRGFVDDDYTMTWDGVPFEDANDPSHHSWAYVPAPAIGYVDFDRSPGTAADMGPANFGGSIHLFSPKLGDAMTLRGEESYGSWNTQQYLGEFNSGLIGGKNPHQNLWFEGHHQTSDGYLTNSPQVRTAGSLKYNNKISDATNFTLIGTVIIVDANTPNNDATRQQIADHGDKYLLDPNEFNPDGSYNAQYYRYETYHVPTNFEIATLTSDLGHGWKADVKGYTYSYSNHQHYQNAQDSDLLAPTPIEEPVNATSGIDKMNQYNRVGEISTVSWASKYGVFRTGAWWEYTPTNRYQIKSDPALGFVHAPGIKNIKFHENFNITTVQPFAEFQLVAIPRWTITAGIKDAFFNMWLKQYQDGKIVGCLCTPSNPGGNAYVTHDAGYNSWLPSVEANFRINNVWSAYGDYGKGSIIPFSAVFDVTGAQVAVTPPPTIASTYQGGTVLKLNHLSMDADFYHIHFVNQYSSFTPSSGPDSGFTYYYATPPSDTNGFEGEGNLYLAKGLSFFMNGTIGEAKYESSSGQAATTTTPAVAASPSAWVALAPHDSESLGLTYQQKAFDVGFFNKRVGSRWNDDGAYHQAVPMDPFWMSNFFFNYTLRNGSHFNDSKIKLSLNNVLDSHDIVTISPANSVSNSLVLYAPSPADTIQQLPGRSVMITFQLGLSPHER
ncbi:MAG TPA: TonB-dependent receptor [Terracidiphilus sp.]|nr:TonB-dependent receptor [Terracidiphilus sp.]